MHRDFDQTTIAAINALGRQFSDATILMHEAIARSVGLSGTDHKYLGILLQRGEMTAGELSQATGLTTGAITGVVDRLEKTGLVSRQFDPRDRRKVLLVPDREKAGQLLGGVFTDLQSRVLQLLSQFDDQALQVIEKYLAAAIAMMHETTHHLNQSANNAKNP
jgi:DNA-binding MarR family transcriptional regulator